MLPCSLYFCVPLDC
uniref:Uncharacterized protein n=1 Tax=Rhizophora mucronata TaxID=61149 RepID=A0A2P2LH52_RHIMU